MVDRNHILRQKHIRSDRLSARLDGKVVENFALQEQIEELTRQVQQARQCVSRNGSQRTSRHWIGYSSGN